MVMSQEVEMLSMFGNYSIEIFEISVIKLSHVDPPTGWRNGRILNMRCHHVRPYYQAIGSLVHWNMWHNVYF